jgi:hypothetical protein
VHAARNAASRSLFKKRTVTGTSPRDLGSIGIALWSLRGQSSFLEDPDFYLVSQQGDRLRTEFRRDFGRQLFCLTGLLHGTVAASGQE